MSVPGFARLAFRLAILFCLRSSGFIAACPSASGSTGLVQSDNFPENYVTGTTCSWTLAASVGSVLQLDIIVHDIYYTIFLLIYDGSHAGFPLIANVTGANKRLTLLTTSNNAHIRFQKTNFYWSVYSGKGFQLFYRQMNPATSFNFGAGITSNYNIYGGVVNASGSVQLVNELPSKSGGMWSKNVFPADNFAAVVKFQIQNVLSPSPEGLGLFVAANSSIDRTNVTNLPYTIDWDYFAGLGALVRPAINSVFATYEPDVSSSGIKNICSNELKMTPCGSHTNLRGATTTLLVTLTNGRVLSETICQNGQFCGPVLASYLLPSPISNISDDLYVGIGAWNSATAYDAVSVQSINVYTAAVVCPFGCPVNMFCSSTGTCICEYGWTGENCTIPVCVPACQNNGTCVTQYVCRCQPGFRGPTCSITYCYQNSTINATATPSGVLQSTRYPDYYLLDNCGWTVIAPEGSAIQLDIDVTGIGSNDFLRIYSDPGNIENTLMSTITQSFFHRFTLVTPRNVAFLHFMADNVESSYSIGFRVVYKVVTYQPLYSYDMTAGNISHWNFYLPDSSPIPEFDNSIRLINATEEQNGAMWAATPFTASDFILNAVIEIGATGTMTDGIAIFVVSNETIQQPNTPDYSPGLEYYVDWDQFSGFAVFANPRTSSIYAATSANATNSSVDLKTCSSAFSKKRSCGGQSLRTLFNLTIAMMASKNITATICRNASQCAQVLTWETSFDNGSSLAQSPKPLYFGIAATNNVTYDYVTVREVRVYTPTVHCTKSCSGNGFCYGNNLCQCAHGWTGSYCQTPVCNCYNGGTCISPYFCACSLNFIGRGCEISVCQVNTTIAISGSGSINSNTYYSYRYEDETRCGYIFTVSPGYVIRLTINMKSMDKKDYFQIYDSYVDAANQGDLVFHASGDNYNAQITSVGSKVLFWFFSDSNGISGMGFTLTYERVVNTTTLGGRLSGYLEPAGYSIYPVDHTWLIQSPNAPYFWFTLYTYTWYSGDELWIYDGNSTNSTQIDKINTYVTRFYQNENSAATLRFKTNNYGNSWRISFEQARIDNCASVSLTSPNGNFSYPSAVGLYPRNVTCSWLITVNPEQVISLDIAGLYLGGPDLDYLFVYDGANDSSTNVLQTSANYFKSKIVTTTNQVFLKFQSNSDYQVGTGFSIAYNATSPTTTPAVLQATIQSLNFPNSPGYLNRQINERWYIRFPTGSVLNVDVIVYLELGCDILRLYEGLSTTTIIDALSAFPLQKYFTTTGSNMLLKFDTDSSSTYHGFKMVITQVSPANITKCSSFNVTGSQNGSLELPSFSSNLFYAHNENCQWRIVVEPSFGIWIDLTVSSIDPSDAVQIYDGSTTSSRLLANVFYINQRQAYVTTSNVVLIRFISNGAWAVGKGFRVVYKQVTRVPFFSYDSTENHANYWSVSATHNASILLGDKSLRLTTQSVMPSNIQNGAMWALRRFQLSDFIIDVNVRIGNALYGSSYNGPGFGVMILRNSTTVQPPTTFSSQYAIDWTKYEGLSIIANPMGNSIYGVFSGTPSSFSHSSCTGSGRVFGLCSSLPVSWLAGATLSATMVVANGSQFTASYCRNGASCTSLLNYTALSSSMASLVSSPTVLGITGYANYDYANSIEVLSATLWVPTSDCPAGCLSSRGVCIASTCNCLKGWTGETCDEPICSNGCLNNGTCIFPETCSCMDGFTGSSCQFSYCITNVTVNATNGGYVETDQYNSTYWGNTRCGWLLQGRPGTVVKVSIAMGTMDRNADELSFYDNELTLLMQTRASYFVSNFTTPQSSVFIYFTTGVNSTRGTGFRIYYEEVSACKMSGFVQPVNYPSGNYYNNQNDQWIISTPLSNVIWLNLTTASFGNDADKLSIYDGTSNSSTLMHQTSTNNSKVALTSSSHTVLLTFSSDSSITGKGFKLEFFASDNQPNCNGTTVIENATRGYIQSDNYPNGYYSHSQTCAWSIQLSSGFYAWLELRISTMELLNDYVAIYDGDSESSPPIIQQSSNGYRASFVSSTERLLIVFKSNGPYITGTGFQVFFRQASLVPEISLINGNITEWSTYLPVIDNIANGTEANRSVLLVPNEASYVGAIWSKFELNMTNFLVKLSLSISNNGTGGNSFGIFFVRNETISRTVNTVPFGVELDSDNYGGLAIFGTSTSIFGSFDFLPGSGNMNRSLCEFSQNFQPSTCKTLSLRRDFELVISLTNGTDLTVTFCPNRTSCMSAVIAEAQLAASIQALDEKFVFGIGAANTPTAYDSIAVNSILFYSTTKCSPSCANDGVCVGENQCQCRDGWMGPTCEEAICIGGCFNGGSCKLPDQCDCLPGFKGSMCEYTHCIRNVTLNATTGGYIETDRYNISYWENTKCGWLIQGKPGTVLKISMHMETMDRSQDLISIYDDGSATTLLMAIKANHFLSNFTTPRSSVFIYFTSGSNSSKGTGFRIYYEEASGGTMNGFIQSFDQNNSGFYSNQSDQWLISLPYSSSIWLDLAKPSYSSFTDTFSIYDGQTNSSPLMYQTTPGENTSVALTSTSNIVLASSFLSNSSGTGFELQFAAANNESSCNRTTLIQNITEGYIQSDNYPIGHYSHSQTCTWSIHLPSGFYTWLELRIATMELLNDYVAIYDGDSESSPQIIQQSTSGYRASFVSSTIRVLIVFKSNGPYISGTGFQIFFRQATLVPEISLINGNITADWTAYLPAIHLNKTNSDSSISLIPNATAGAIWNNIGLNMTDFVVKVSLSFDSEGFDDISFGIFFVRNETISRTVDTFPFGVDLDSDNYGGLAILGTSTSVFGSFTYLPGSGNMNRSSCACSQNFQPPSCDLETVQQKVDLTISLINGTLLTVTLCPNGTMCQNAAIKDALLSGSIQALNQKFIFGVGAFNPTSDSGSVNLEQIEFYSAASCSGGCANAGVCVGDQQCHCREGWTGVSCSEPVCPGGCLNGGFCEYPFSCHCPPKYTDPNCGTPLCSPTCVNGNCTSPDKCTCETEWTGVLCDIPICSPECNPLGGICGSPNNCNCSEGWVGNQCETAICIYPCLNGGNCTSPGTCSCDEIDWTGAKDNCSLPICTKSECGRGGICEAPHYCVCKAGWVNDSICDTAICSKPCLNGGQCSAPETCSCILGFRGPQCEIASTYFSTEDIAQMTDDQLRNSQPAVQAAAFKLASEIAKRADPEEVTGMLGTLDALLSRYSNVTDLTPERFTEITAVCSAAADGMMMAATGSKNNGSDADTGFSLDDGTFKCKVDKDGDVEVFHEEVEKPNAKTKENLRTMFNAFTGMLVNMFSNLRTILKPGSNMTFTGDFYGAVVFLYRLRDLPGTVIESSLAKAELAKVDDPMKLFSGWSPKCSPLKYNSMLAVVMSSFIVNVMEVDKPFNMPTVSIRFYCPEQAELVCNPEYPARITAKPSVQKAALFNSQKMDAQCDVSRAKCDLSENADQMGSLAKFPLTVDAGDFVTIFPAIEYNYTAYLSFNSQPKATNYHWRINATGKEISAKWNNSFAEPRDYNRHGVDYRFIIPEKAIKQYALENNANSSIVLNIYTKKDLSNFPSLDDLPQSACDLQRVFGYHLRIGLAKSTKSKRAIDESSVDGFELEPESTESAVVFKSSYFGDFGSDLVVSPNTIEFSDIFANFATLLSDNASVFSFQIVAVVFFIVGTVFAFKFDKEDLKEWAFLPIISNQRYQTSRYLISVHCSRVKNSKLEPRISIRLDGSLCDTTWRLLDDGVRKKVFNGVRPANFTLTTRLPVGRVEAAELKVESNLVRENKKFSIHIDRIVVVDTQQGLKYVFLVKSKMCEGDKIRRDLATEDEVKGYGYLLMGHSKTSFTDIHPWLSIAQRPLASNWTRCERLACVVSALFMAMLVNAMFYGKEASSPKSVGIKIGGLVTLSWFSVWVGFIGCVIVIPPTFVIGFIFKNVKRRSAERSHWMTVFNLQIATANRDTKAGLNEKPKKSFQLPYGTVIIAWILVASCIGVSSFIVIMYSLSWGSSKSIQWLNGMMMSIVQDIILIQPIKVFLTAIVNATIHNLPDDGLRVGKLVYNAQSDRRKIELYFKLRDIFTGIFHHVIYVFIFAAVIASMTNPFAYTQVKVLKQQIGILRTDQVTGTVHDPAEIFEWLEWGLIPGLMNENHISSGLRFSKRNKIYETFNPYVTLLGPIRLRQQRVSPTTCPLMNAIPVFNYATRYSTSLNSNCQTVFSNFYGVGDSSERRAFNDSWNVLAETAESYYPTSNVSQLKVPWIHRETEDMPYSGWEATYTSGGYYIDLPLKVKNAIKVVRYLRARKWLDNSTTMLMVDFNLFNPQLSNIFIPIRVVFEALGAGAMTYHARLFPLQLYQYSGASSTLVFVVQLLWMIILISHTVRVARSIKKDGPKKYGRNGWNVLDAIQIVLGFAIVAMFAFRIYYVIRSVERLQTVATEFYNLDILAYWEDLMFCLFGIEFFLVMLLFFRHLSLNKHWAVLLSTLSKGKLDIISYGAVFTVATVLFAGIAHLIMGQDYWSYSTYSRAIRGLIEGLIGTVKFSALATHFHLFIVMVYMSVVMFLGTNMFVTLILEAYSEVAVNIEEQTEWDAELANYLENRVKNLLKTGKATTAPAKTDGDIFEPIGDENFGKLEMVVHRFVKLVDQKFESELNQNGEVEKCRKCQLLWAADMLNCPCASAEQLNETALIDASTLRRSLHSRKKVTAPDLRIIDSEDGIQSKHRRLAHSLPIFGVGKNRLLEDFLSKVESVMVTDDGDDMMRAASYAAHTSKRLSSSAVMATISNDVSRLASANPFDHSDDDDDESLVTGDDNSVEDASDADKAQSSCRSASSLDDDDDESSVPGGDASDADVPDDDDESSVSGGDASDADVPDNAQPSCQSARIMLVESEVFTDQREALEPVAHY